MEKCSSSYEREWLPTKNILSGKAVFQTQWRTFQNKDKLKWLMYTNPVFKKIIKRIIYIEGKKNNHKQERSERNKTQKGNW
jgi:hypothetical protein